MRFVKNLNRRVVVVETALAGGLTFSVFAIVLLQVMMRYLFERPNPWSEELSRFCFIWLCMLGAALAVEFRSHFVFDHVFHKLAPRLQSLVRRCTAAFLAAAALGLILFGLELVDLTRSQRSAALDLPMSWVYASVPVAGLLMLLHVAAGLGTPADTRAKEDY